MRAIGLSPCRRTAAPGATTSAEAPSLMGEEFPGVTAPSLRKAGLSVESFSTAASSRGPSSVSRRPFGSSTGRISSRKQPSLMAAVALLWAGARGGGPAGGGPGAADLVGGEGAGGVGDGGAAGGGSGGILAETGLQHVAHEHLVDRGRIDAGAADGLGDDEGAESGGG